MPVGLFAEQTADIAFTRGPIFWRREGDMLRRPGEI